MTVDGILLHGDHALSSMLFNHPDYHVDRLVREVLGGTMSLPVRRVHERAVMLSGPGYTVYGHWLVDIPPRLWILHEGRTAGPVSLASGNNKIWETPVE